MTRLFISYSRENAEMAESLEKALVDQGVSVWRDQASIYGGQQWPKVIGEAIADNDAVLLLWSREAAASHFVEFEWTTALALRKTILPCLLDSTALPASLSAVNGIRFRELEHSFPRLLRSLNLEEKPPETLAARRVQLLKKLERLEITEPEQAARAVTTLLPDLSEAASSEKNRETASEAVKLGERYRVMGLLGAGGMGKVYHVYDRELDREVALKIIRPELASDDSLIQRFKREIDLSSQVTHKNVLRVYDLGESEGVQFLTMQYVAGEDLGSLLEREEQLPASRLTHIFTQICQGLAAAHEAGILHRDLKPANIMIDEEDRVYITDFGLARAQQQSRLTEAGKILGTPDYLSPEQVKGEGSGKQSDIYSLGVILYEMCTGARPFSGDTDYEVMIQRVQKPPQPAEALNPEIPPALVKVLRRSLAVDLAERYPTVDEILDNLRPPPAPASLWEYLLNRPRTALATLALLVALLALGSWWIYQKGLEEGDPSAQLPVLAVLPFENRTGDEELEGYGESLARLISDQLAGSRFVRVVSMARVEELNSAGALPEKAAQAGIDFLLSGEILADADGLAVAARLSQADRGDNVEAERLEDLDSKTLLGSSQRIVLLARRGLKIPPTEEVDVFAADFAARNPNAYVDYNAGLQALFDFGYAEAEKAFLKALQKAPDFSMARYRLATVLAAMGRMEEAQTQIGVAAKEASGLSERESLYVRAAQARFNREKEKAIQTYGKLIELYPYETEARYSLAFLYWDNYQYAEEVEVLETLVRLEPEMHVPWSMLGEAYLSLQEFEKAENALRRLIDLEPEHPNGYELLGDLQRALSRFDLAKNQYEKALSLDPDFYSTQVKLARLDALSGRIEAAERRLLTLAVNERAPPLDRIDAAFDLASVRRAQGKFSEAAFYLKALEPHLVEEKVREAQALAVRGTSLMAVGNFDEAGRLIDLSVERSPSVPTRYLFARGLLESQRNDPERVRGTAAEILKGALEPENPDRTVEKAASYLSGLALLAGGDAEGALGEFRKAVDLKGYEYAVYRLGLARAYLACQRFEEALREAEKARQPLDPLQPRPRLDLELDRVQALLVQAEIKKAQGRDREAADLARRFLREWGSADPQLPRLAEARNLAG